MPAPAWGSVFPFVYEVTWKGMRMTCLADKG